MNIVIIVTDFNLFLYLSGASILDLTRLLVVQLKELRTRLNEIYREVSEQFGQMPIFAMLKEKVT